MWFLYLSSLCKKEQQKYYIVQQSQSHPVPDQSQHNPSTKNNEIDSVEVLKYRIKTIQYQLNTQQECFVG